MYSKNHTQNNNRVQIHNAIFAYDYLLLIYKCFFANSTRTHVHGTYISIIIIRILQVFFILSVQISIYFEKNITKHLTCGYKNVIRYYCDLITVIYFIFF